jgi:DNA-binding GntR family transcriptional regulator
MAHETLYRALRELEAAGLARRENGRIFMSSP